MWVFLSRSRSVAGLLQSTACCPPWGGPPPSLPPSTSRGGRVHLINPSIHPRRCRSRGGGRCPSGSQWRARPHRRRKAWGVACPMVPAESSQRSECEQAGAQAEQPLVQPGGTVHSSRRCFAPRAGWCGVGVLSTLVAQVACLVPLYFFVMASNGEAPQQPGLNGPQAPLIGDVLEQQTSIIITVRNSANCFLNCSFLQHGP